ncbi:MBL fold metallo-hydrolase [Algiphilus aromaticivorans]|jgi:L-ascorbate metabolism protein UlaG (beta-lactamase superfamily)|uniref:MBL fold metallo-hydrolase n=1 Tax=Algiphilus aromaticivorans TaxID=382454 RepID=UPI000A03F442|nr:MBL fold metallo-hydrolase [Algiphilus aromaticivorans]
MMRRALLALLLLLLLLAGLLTAWLHWPRSGPDPSDLAESSEGAVTLQWLGVSAALLRAGDSAVMIDPFFTRRPGKLGLLTNRPTAPDAERIRAWLQRLGIERLDAVAVSHAHYDHALDAGVVARLTGATLLGSEGVANIGRGAGLPEAQLRTVTDGEEITAGEFRLRFIASRHAGATGGRPRGLIEAPLEPPEPPLAYRQQHTWSILVTHPQARLLHHGSAGFTPGALADVQADAVMLGVALIDDLPRYLDEVVGATGAGRVFAVHWDDFTRPLSEPLRPLPLGVNLPTFFAGARDQLPAVDFRTLPLAEPVALAPE